MKKYLPSSLLLIKSFQYHRWPLARTAIVLPAAMAVLSLPTLANAVSVDVTTPGNIASTPGISVTPANGDVWNLQSAGIYLINTVQPLIGVSPGLTINGNGNTLTLNDGAGHYGQFFVSGATTLSLADVTLTGGLTTGPGGVISQRSGDVIILTAAGADLAFQNNIAYTHGGAIFAPGGNVLIGSAAAMPNAITFTGNTAGYDAGGTFWGDAIGGAIAASYSVNLTGATITLTNNRTTGLQSFGGGAIASTGGRVDLTGAVTLSDNSTAKSSGGGIYAAGAVTIGGDLTANNNIAVTGAGGAIFAYMGDVTVTGSVSMGSNIAGGGDGGAIDAVVDAASGIGGSVMLATAGGDVTLRDNIASEHGGAIAASKSITIGNGNGAILITGNKAGYDASGTNIVRPGSVGGALAAIDGSVSLSASTIKLLNNTAAGGNGAGAGGGAIYSTGVTKLTGSAIDLSGNSAAIGNGGGIFSEQAVTVTGSLTANRNTALGGNGGAIYAVSGDVTVTGSLKANSNSASSAGGAIYAVSGDVVVNSDVSMDSNTAQAGNGGAIDAVNGAVSLAATGGNVSLTNNRAANGGAVAASGDVSVGNINIGSMVTIASNTAGTNGGAIYTATGNTSMFGSVSLIGNRATSGSGGAIWAEAGDVAVTGSLTAAGNTAGGNGGAIDALNVVVNGDANLTGNLAGGSGGGIYTETREISNVTVSGSLTADSNTAGIDGGAIDGGEVSIGGDAILTNNTAQTGNGGAIEAEATVAVGGNLTANGNTAPQGQGGAIYIEEPGDLTVGGDLSLTDNSATSGGAIEVSAGSLSIGGNLTANGNQATADNGGAIGLPQGGLAVTGDVSLSGNQASGSGGSISSEDGTMTIGGSLTAAGNTAVRDGGVMDVGNLTVVGDAILTNNTAQSGNGGAIEAESTVAVGGNLTANGNTAPQGQGGAIYIEKPGDLTVGGDLSLTDNSATSGGAIEVSAGSLSIGGNLTANGNQATADNGGAIAAENGNVTVIGNVTADSNTAATDGGVIDGGNVTIGGNATVTNNTAQTGNGGAITGENSVTVTGTVTATGNMAAGNGGAIAAEEGDVSVGSVTATGNTAQNGQGGVIYAENSATVNATSDSVFTNNTAGGLGGAIYVDDSSLTLNASGGNITFSGNMENTASAPQANAIYLNNEDGTAGLNLNTAAGNTISFYDPIANNPANGIITVTKNGPGTVSFDGTNFAAADALNLTSQLYANTQVNEGTFEVANNAVYGVHAADIGQSVPTAFTTAPGTTLQGGVAGTVVADQVIINGKLNIAGRQQAVPGVFTIDSNSLTFGPSSQVLFNTTLNGSNVQQTDLLKLTLDGSAINGTVGVVVGNIGGAGGQTTGNGIELVQVTGNNGITTGAFTLANRVVAGPYEYTLYHGSADTSGPGNWYLRSTLDCALSPDSSICQPATPVSSDPVPSFETPHFRVETSVYAALPSMALLYGHNLIDTLHERVGDEEDIRNRADLHQSTPDTGGWGRVIGIRGKQDGDGLGIYGSGPQYDYSFVGLQVGQDLFRRERADGGRDHIGVYFAYGNADGTVTHFDGATGTNKFDAYTLGGYWTHFGETGWYVDTVLQGTHYDTTSTAHADLPDLNTHDNGFAASVEGGKPFRLSKGYFIEPQAQLTYQTIKFSDTSDSKALVAFSDADSLVGRIGARFGRTWSSDDAADGRRLTVWLRPNIWREFRGNPLTRFSADDNPAPFRADLSGTWGEINGGISGQISRNVTLFANASYNRRFDDQGYDYDGKIGIRFNW